MEKLYKSLATASLLLLFFSCSTRDRAVPRQGRDRFSSVIAQRSESYSEREQSTIANNDPAIKKFIVPSEIAIINGNVRVTSSSYSEAFNLINNSAETLSEKINAIDNCTVEIIDYKHPVKTYSKRSLNDNIRYHSSLDILITAAFNSANSVLEKSQQLNQCLQAIPQIESDNQSQNTDLKLNLSPALPTIINANKYRQQILESKFIQLQKVANLSDNPPQFDASETKCTSNGDVQIVSRTLNNIELDVDFKCQQFGQ